MFIEGRGGNNIMEVNDDGEALVFATTQTIERRQAREEQKVWNLPFDGIDPVGADDYFIHIKNTGTELLVIPKIRIETTVAGTCEVHEVTGTASYAAGSDITPVNRYVGSNVAPTATIKTDTNTTGLTTQGTLLLIPMATVNDLYEVKIDSNIFIPPGQQVALLWDTGTGILSGGITLVQVSATRVTT